jgi:hypothetical protein
MTNPKGILVFVLRSALGDCTNGGITSKRESVILVGPNLPELSEVKPGEAYLKVVRNPVKGFHAEPAVNGAKLGEGLVGPMFGGNFVTTSDDRFCKPYGDVVRVHDRFETVQQYNSNWD